MALIAGDVIDTARDWHASFSVRDHPDKGLLRALGACERDLLQRALQVNEDYSRVVASTALPLATFATGIAVPANLMIHGAEYVDNTGRAHDIDLKPMMYRDDPAHPLTLYLGDDVVYLRGTAQDWNGLTAINIIYTPEPVMPATLAATLTLEEDARSALTAYLVLMMARRGTLRTDIPKPDVRAALLWYERAEKEFLHAIANRRAGQTFGVRETW